MSFKTADLCDEFCGDDCTEIQAVGACFNNYGGKLSFYGEVITLKLFEDNQLVRDQVNSDGRGADGKGKVLVIDGGASMRRAVLGDMLAAKAVENGWSGIVINGCIRDSVDMETMDLGVMALGTHPLKTVKNGVGQTNVTVSFENLTINPGDFIYVDEDGMIVSAKALI
jgi:regulator of ribonuclease activity A